MTYNQSIESTEVTCLRHKNKRKNIPTLELRDFVPKDEKHNKTVSYQRNNLSDPQLIWANKSEQDRSDVNVPLVPIYIQEKIHPKAIISDIKAYANKQEVDPQLDLFSDFNDLSFEKVIEFYKHEHDWSNRMILGDSLLVMTSLAEKEHLKGKVQMIYFDPPYGIKFGSNWQVSTRRHDIKDGNKKDVTREPEQIKAFRDTWKLGIHSYLSYLQDRLIVARELLSNTGSIFVQIGDENVHYVRCLIDETFGKDNFIAMIPFFKISGMQSKFIGVVCDYLLWYAKDKDNVKCHKLFVPRDFLGKGAASFQYFETPEGERGKLSPEQLANPRLIPPDYKLFVLNATTSQGWTSTGSGLFRYQGKEFRPPLNRHWTTSAEGLERLGKANRLVALSGSLSFIKYFNDFPLIPLSNVWTETTWGFSASDKIYVVQTNTKVVSRCLLMTTDPGDLVLDPTCGSGTTAYVAEQWGRRWITIDTSRVALALARTRLMTAKYPYYLLADSPEGLEKESEIFGIAKKEQSQTKTEYDIRKGFVYKRVPHITLRAIANNEQIDFIYDKWEKKLRPLLNKLNEILRCSWHEWEVPKNPEKNWPKEAVKLLEQWLKIRKKRQEEIDDAISKSADYEILYDQPYRDNKKVRVTGPFTVESLSPYRLLSVEEDRPESEVKVKTEVPNQFEILIINNLKKSGIQNTRKNERLKFDRLEPYASKWLHAAGEYTENGKSKRVAVCIGPEHGTVGPDLIKEAAKEAVQGIGFDLLIICGFAFDPHIPEEVKRYGDLNILPVRMSAELSMGDELLKETGSGNLFMIFGEPDLHIEVDNSGMITVEIVGLDIYDPTTGEIRASSTDDIACWFIDTNYNEESFFVRHAYFTGTDRPFEKLSKALKSEINEDAWEQLYRTKSRPFKKPNSGKIAVKVINHYGDEVLRVYSIPNATSQRN